MPSVVIGSSTYGVPVNSSYGYKVTVDLAVRFDDSGNFIHSAPWSVDDQGKRDVSHGCINISPTNARWFFDNFGAGQRRGWGAKHFGTLVLLGHPLPAEPDHRRGQDPQTPRSRTAVLLRAPDHQRRRRRPQLPHPGDQGLCPRLPQP